MEKITQVKLFTFIAIGVLLGPTVLGLQRPDFISNLGMISSFMFLLSAGLELSLRKTMKQFKEAAIISLGAFLLPLFAGYLAAVHLLDSQAHPLFIATAMAVSALPVIVQLLKEANLYTTDLGRMIVSAATLCDVLAWVLFSLLLPKQSWGPWLTSHLPVLMFLGGLVISDSAILSEKWIQRLEKTVRWIFAPVFFIALGWGLNLLRDFDLQQALIATAVAFIGKIVGAYTTARWRGFSDRDSTVIGLSLNARGAMEILMATFGLRQGFINPTLFTSLVVMAILTSLVPALYFKIRNPATDDL